MNNKRKQLYDNLIGTGKVSDVEIGSLDEFRNAIKDEASARQFHKNLLGAGFSKEEIGSEDEFYNSISSDFEKPITMAQKLRNEGDGPYTHEYDKDMNLVGGTAYNGEPVAAPYSTERASLKEQVADNNRKFPKMEDLPWTKPQGGVNGHLSTNDLASRLNQTYKEGGMEPFLHSNEDKKVNAQYTPKKEEKAEDVWTNAANKFLLTERGSQLQGELAQIQDEITNKYLTEFKNSDEYKAYAGQKYTSQAELDEANKVINNLFITKYGEAINNDLQPYQQAYNNEMLARYGVEVESGLNKIAKNEAAVNLGKLSTSVNSELESIEKKIQDRTKAVRNENWKPGMPSSRDDQELARLRGERTYLDGAQELIEDSEHILQAAKDEKDGTFVGGVLRGASDKLFDVDTWTMGVSDLVGNLRMKNVLEKADKGEKLTKAEEALLDAAVNNMAINAYYRSDLGRGYKAGEVTGESLPFMLEFIINPISSSGNAIAQRLLSYGLKRFGIKTIGKNATKATARFIGDMAAASGMVATTGVPGVLGETVDRMNRDYKYGVDEDGNLNVIKEGDTSFGEALGKSATTRFLENQSEMIFYAFKGASKMMKGVDEVHPGGINGFMDALKNSKVGQLYLRYKNNPRLKEFRDAAKVGGIGEEYLEEVYNNFANVALGEMSYEDAVSLDKNIDTFLGLAPTQVLFSAWGLGSMAYERHKNRKDMERAFGLMSEEQKRKLEELQKMGKLSYNKDIAFFLRETIGDENLTQEEKRAEIEYLYDLAKQNAINDIAEAEVEDNVATENAIIDSVTDPSTGKYAEVDRWIVDEEGERVAQHGYIVGWIGESPIFLPEGMENIEENRVALKPAEWNPESLEEMDNERVKAINEEMIRTEAAQQAETESKYAPEVLNAQMQQGVPFNTPTSQIVPVSPMPEGNGWLVEEYPLDTNNKVAKQPIVRELTNDEFRDMLQAQLEAQEAAQAQIAAEEQAAAPEVVEENVTEEVAQPNQPTEEVATGNNLSPVEEVAQPQAEVQPQAPVIPTKKDGSIDFVTYGKDNSFKELGNLYGEKMPHKVEVTAKALAEDVIKAQQAVEVDNPFKDVDLAQIDAIFAESEEEYQNYINNEQGRTSEVVEGNDNVLSEEQSDNTGRTERSESEGNSDGISEQSVSESEATHPSQQEVSAEEKRRIPLRERANEWAKALGVQPIFIESIEEAPTASIRAEIEDAHKNGQVATGFVSNGKAYFFMPDLTDLSEVDKTFIHEVVAHKGLKEMLGEERFNKLCDKVWDMMSEKDKAFYENYPIVRDMKDATERHRAAADEYIAALSESVELTPEQKSVWDYIVEFVRDALDKALNGIIGKSQITNDDIAKLIKISYANLKSGKTEGASVEGERFNAKKVSDRRQEKNRMNNTIDQAVALVMGQDVKEAKTDRLKREQKRKEDAAEIYESVLSGDFNDVTLQKINDYIDDSTPLNPFGRRISQRLPQKLERKLLEGARTNIVDALFSRISESAVPASRRASEEGRREIEERKKEALKGWAIATNNWYTDLSAFTDETEPFGEGTDSKVYAAKEDGYVIKTSFGKPMGKRFRPDIDTVVLFNRVFPNSPYEIVGYGEFDGKFARILKQPAIDFAEVAPLTIEERVEYMRSLGFEPINEAKTAFSNGEIIAADIQKSNIVKDAEGNVTVIDADMKLHTKDVGGNYTYPPVEADLPENPHFRVVEDKNGRKSLVGLHNISEEKLKKAIKQGGLANPSMAVIDMDKQAHVEYGDITLVAPAELIDKNTGRSAGTYMGDAWTPVYPKVTLQLDNKGWKKINQYIESIVEDRELQNNMKYGAEMYMKGENGMYMNFAFLKAKGLNPEIFYKNNDGYISTDDIKKLLGVEEIDTSFEGYSKLKELPEETLEELKLWARTYGNKAKIDSHKKRLEKIKNQYGEDSKAYKLMTKPSDELGYGEFDRLVVDTKRKERDNGKIDSYKTFNEANYYVAQNGLRQEFENWMDELLLDAGAKEVFFAGYTPSGNKRYMANTIENVSKFMNKQSKTNAYDETGFGATKALFLKKLNTLEEIREQKGKLVELEEYRETTQELSDRMGDLISRLSDMQTISSNKYMNYDYAASRLQEAMTKRNPIKYLNDEYDYDIDKNGAFAEDLLELIKDVKDSPARYFETKFERPVYLNEFAAAVVPQGTSKDVVDALTEAGLPVEEYEKNNNEARMAAVDKVASEVDGVRFRFIGERGAANLDKAEEATTRLDNLAVAREMEAADKDAKAIKLATGWERGADGLWRYEVADNLNFDYYANVDYKKRHPELAKFEELRHKYNSSLLMGTEALTEEEQKEYDALEKEFGGYKEYHRSRKLKDYLDAPELFDAYPELRNVELLFMEMERDTLGKYLPGEKTIVLNSNMKLSGRGFIEQVLVHEIQHAIQHIEGFEQGANKNMQDPNKVAQKAHNREFMQSQLDKHIAERDELLKQKDTLNDKMSAWYDSNEEDAEFDDKMNEYNRQYDEIESQLEIADRKVAWDEKWLDATKKAKTELGEEGYAKVAGEVEARNVTSRMKMSDFDRRNTLASETEDVAREDQIFLKDALENASRFRVSDKGKQIQEEVDKFTSKYASKPVELIDPEMTDEEIEDAIDWQHTAKDLKAYIKESKSMGGYVGELDKILIFVENMKMERMEEAMFHENLHPFVDNGEYDHLLNKLYENGKDDEALARARRFSDREPEAKRPIEFFNYAVSYGQVNGNLEDVLKYFDKEEQAELLNLLKTNGYDYEVEQGRRRRNEVLGGLSRGEEDSERILQHQEGGQESEGRVLSTSESKESAKERAERLKGLFDKVADMGLQGVLGNGHYDKAMMDIYRELPEEARKIVADDALSTEGIDFIKAMDRFLNEKAEPSIWGKVASVIREWLRKAGFNLELTPNEVKYIWWRSQKPLDRNNVIEVAEDTYKKYQLKVGEFEDSPNPDGDGGGTRFSVKPKTKAELKNEVRDLKEDVKDLKDEVRELKKQVKSLRSGSKEEWERQQRAITSFIQGRLTKEAGESLGKTRIEQLLRLVNNASTASDLRKPLQFIEQVINSATIENIAEKMDKLIKTKLQGETNRGVAKGVVVDEATRRLFDSIRGTFKDLISTSIDSELRSVRGEILRLGKEINALPEDDIQGRTILKSRQDALKSRREELEKEQEELQRQNIIETKETLKNRYDELVDAMDAHINGEGIWTQEMQDEYDSIPLREKLADIRESQDAIDKIMADAVTTRRNAYLSKGSTRQQLLVEANMLEDNYVIAQEELIRLMKEVSQELSEIIKEGKSRLAKRKQALAERRQAIVSMGIAAVKDKKVQPLNANLTKKEKFEKWMDNSFLKTISDFMTAPLNSFNFMLKYIDRNHTIGEGELYNHFMKSSEGALEANNQLYDGLKSYNSAIEEKAKEIFGKDIESVMKDSGKEHKNKVHKQYMYDSATYKEGEMYPITITKGQALYVWLVWRQDDGHGKLLADGWNDQSIKEIEDLIGEDYMKFGEWITDDFFPELREKKYNKTHIEMFGTSIAKREHYFPFKVLSSDIQEKGEMGESYSGMPSTITGNIIKRTINKSKIDTEKNAFDMIYKYGNDMETWNAMAKLRQDLNFLHASKAFRNYLEANGKGLFGKFMKSAEVAVKAYNNGEADAVNDLFAKINRMWAGSNIGFRLNTAMKQILSYPAFTAYSGNLKYQGYLAKYMMNWVGNYKWALENLPAFRNRVESGDMGMTGMTDPTFDLGKYINKLGEWGMVPNQLVDALTCAAGARSVYDFEFERAKKAGLSEEEAMNVARYNAEIAFNETQQSSRAEFVSPTQVSRNVLIKSMMNYQNSNVGYQRMGNEGLLEIIRAKHVYEQDIKNGMSDTEAKKKLANSVMRGTRKAVVAFTILPGLWYLGGRGIVGITAPLISSLFGGGGDDEPYLDDETKEGLLLSILLGTIAGTSGGQAIASVVQGREYEPMAYVKELSKVIADAFKDGYNMNTTKNIALKLAKFGGVNVETFENIYLGVEHAIKTGNFDLVDFMFLINLPASQRKEMAKELYSDMPFMEYAEKMARAQKLFDDYRKSLPYSKEKTKSKETSIKKDYVIEQLDSHKQDALENEKEFRKLEREYNEAENKEEWLKEHPEYKELEKEYGEQLVTKEVNKEVKKLK